MIKKILLVIFLIISSLWLSDYFNLVKISLDEKLEETIKTKTSFQSLVRGPITFHFLPWPHFKIEGIQLYLDDRSSLEFASLDLQLNFSYLLELFNKEMVDLVLTKGEKIHADKLSVKGKITNIKNLFDKKLNFLLEIGEVKIATEPNVFLSKVIINFQDPFYSKGLVNYQDKDFKYSLELKNSNCRLQLDSNAMKIQLLAEDFLFDTNNLNKLNFSLLLDKEFFTQDPKLMAEGNLLNFSGEILKEGDILSLDNYQISGNLLSNPEIKLDIYPVTEGISEVQANFNSSSLDLSFLPTQLIPSDFLQKIAEQLSYFFKNPSLNFKGQVVLGEVLLAKDQIINNFKLDLIDVMGRLLLKDFSAEIEDQSKINLSGLVRSNDFRSKFEGKIDIETNNAKNFYQWFYKEPGYEVPALPLKLSSDFYAIQNYLTANNLKILLGNSEIIGRVNLATIPYAAPSRSYFLRGLRVNLNDFFLNQKFNNYLEKLYLADKDRSGEEYFTLTSLHNGLRLFKNNFHLEGFFEKSEWNDAKIDELDLMINISPNHFNLQRLFIKDADTKGQISLDFYLPILRPQIKIKADFESLNKDYLMKFFPTKIVAGKLNNFSANNYDLSADFSINHLIFSDKKEIKDLEAAIKLEMGDLQLQKMYFNLDYGRVEMAGNMNLVTINPNFSLNFNLYNLPGYLLPQTLGLEGGLWSALGSVNGNQKGWNRLNGKADFEGAEVLLLGFDLNKSLEILEGSYTEASKKKALDYYSQYGSTGFKKLKGNLEITNGIFAMQNIYLTNDRIAGGYSLAYDPASDEMKGLGQFAFINKLNKKEFRVKAEVASKNNIRSSKVDLEALKESLTE